MKLKNDSLILHVCQNEELNDFSFVGQTFFFNIVTERHDRLQVCP